MQTTDTAGARREGSERSGSRSPGMARGVWMQRGWPYKAL